MVYCGNLIRQTALISLALIGLAHSHHSLTHKRAGAVWCCELGRSVRCGPPYWLGDHQAGPQGEGEERNWHDEIRVFSLARAAVLGSEYLNTIMFMH